MDLARTATCFGLASRLIALIYTQRTRLVKANKTCREGPTTHGKSTADQSLILLFHGHLTASIHLKGNVPADSNRPSGSRKLPPSALEPHRLSILVRPGNRHLVFLPPQEPTLSTQELEPNNDIWAVIMITQPGDPSSLSPVLPPCGRSLYRAQARPPNIRLTPCRFTWQHHSLDSCEIGRSTAIGSTASPISYRGPIRHGRCRPIACREGAISPTTLQLHPPLRGCPAAAVACRIESPK